MPAAVMPSLERGVNPRILSSELLLKVEMFVLEVK